MEQIGGNGRFNKITIHDLNHDCLMKIFSYLDISGKLTVEKVCRRWLDVSKCGWPEVDRNFNLPRSDFSTRQLEVILCRSGRFLKKIDIICGSSKEVRRLKLVKKYCKNVEYFKIKFDRSCTSTHKPAYYNILANVFERNENLKDLRVEFLSSDMINHDFLENINADALKSLSIHSIELPLQLSANICKFHKLECLELKNLIIEEESLQGFGELVELIRLDLSSSSLPIPYIEVMKNFTKLEELDLGWSNTEIEDHHISAIVKNCVNLREININEHERLTDNCFVDISKLQNLEILSMDSLPNVTSRAIEHMIQLKWLSCNGCEQIDDDGALQLIRRSSNLETLMFEGVRLHASFLKDVNEAIKYRKSDVELVIFVTNDPEEDTPHPLPENCSPLLTICSSIWEE